ncbi:Probable RNA polymerase sigma factor fecI [Segatella buccae]|uniref:Probable RNA polymerase sigma factor fecI n=1 Tax=Segatella buccae TaxID=28126 RepID=A0AAQ1ZJP2_9BACT|nr:sigma-70, region 4 [Segatella buccae D17]SUB80633.1 Probable RNA polymerase sigma factor fecI [Segatella buccae]
MKDIDIKKDSLPDKCRQVFLMSKRDNMKYQEIAQGLGISEKTVEHHISKALKTLRGKEKDIFYCLSWMA